MTFVNKLKGGYNYIFERRVLFSDNTKFAVFCFLEYHITSSFYFLCFKMP